MVQGKARKSKTTTAEAPSKDVVMGGVKKKINKVQRRKAKGVAAGAAVKESRKARRRRVAASAVARGESADVLKERQAAEWAEMKAKVAKLKKERKNLPKKGSKDLRQAVAQNIRQLVEEMQVRHVAELKAAGLAVPSATSGRRSAADALMSDL
eukprot:TRINITY_DN58664_c0_g1_i1.p2 TRINITY_DN58664_c0_g1~~TRINITY_DN58664_c0_g1_i1.p2  ORF type:complete len:174 (-),score=47.55 TRINITY_DN58664_c0_g1_i1:13-474(-)